MKNTVLGYQYKIQWLLSFGDLIKLLNIFRANSFDVINVRDADLKIIDSYSDFGKYPSLHEADEAVIQYMNEKHYNNSKSTAVYYEVVKK